MTAEELEVYEADLEVVLSCLDHPPPRGSPEGEDFARSLQRVEQAQAELCLIEPDTGPPVIAEEVRQRLAALRARAEPHEKPHFLTGGEDGLGPTLGMHLERP